VEGPEQDPVLFVGASREVLQDGVEDSLRTISRQVGEDNDEHPVSGVGAVGRIGFQEQSPIAVNQLGNG